MDTVMDSVSAYPETSYTEGCVASIFVGRMRTNIRTNYITYLDNVRGLVGTVCCFVVRKLQIRKRRDVAAVVEMVYTPPPDVATLSVNSRIANENRSLSHA
jgi:hypothetical protein